MLDLASLVANGILCSRGTGARICVAVLCNLCVNHQQCSIRGRKCSGVNDVRLFPSLLTWSVVPLIDSEAELKAPVAVSEAELAMFLGDGVSERRVAGYCCLDVLCSVHFERLKLLRCGFECRFDWKVRCFCDVE